MKYKSLGLAILSMTFAGSMLAQNQISGTSKCKEVSPPQSLDIGDRAGHTFLIMKMSCTYNTPLEIAGVKSTTYSVTEATEVTGAKFQDRGYLVMTMDNGDKAYGRTQDAGTMKEGGAFTDEGTWSITGGTGKLKGMKGKGTYKSSGVVGGVEGSQMEGESRCRNRPAHLRKNNPA